MCLPIKICYNLCECKTIQICPVATNAMGGVPPTLPSLVPQLVCEFTCTSVATLTFEAKCKAGGKYHRYSYQKSLHKNGLLLGVEDTGNVTVEHCFSNLLVDITKLPCYPHRHSTTVSLEPFTLNSIVFIVFHVLLSFCSLLSYINCVFYTK